MISLQPDQVTPALHALFDPAMPAGLRCFSVLAGTTHGQILTDHPTHPKWGAVREDNDGTLYLGGQWETATVLAMVSHLSQTGDVLVGFWEGDPLSDLLPPEPGYTGEVLEFMDRPTESADLDAILRRLPEGYEIRRADSALLKRFVWYDDILRYHGGADAYLQNCLAVALMHGDEILSEASTGPLINGVRELGVITREAYRQRGWATLTCAYLVKWCEQLGARTYWNCATQNIASAKVARNLGYQTERRYHLRAWFKKESE
jgi:RimJ/RimL family protein N-acetyltransferase